MFLTDSQGRILTWNEGVRELLGYSEEEWVGQHCSIIFVPEEQAAELCAAEMRVAAERGAAADIRWHRKKDGTELFAHGAIHPVWEAGNLLCFVKVISDETARKHLEDALTESNAALEQFAATASHDLQEPLRAIQSYAELLRRRTGGKLDIEEQEFLQYILQSAQRMSCLTQNLLAYASLSAPKEEPQTFSLNDAVEAGISQLHQTLLDTDAQITCDPLPNVEAVYSQMVRLFLNLFSNSLKYRRPETPLRVHVSARQKVSFWEVSVSDNGQGFEQKYAEEIFYPFQRLKNKEQSGTGLGLAICKRIVESHGGCIRAVGEQGKGATFFFTIRVRANA
ncbi:MAG TPA: ATP-binding protein [Bryobacteraceae bacterium]|nr:ATP-binding protein [Bryobacteraceae bacterium]